MIACKTACSSKCSIQSTEYSHHADGTVGRDGLRLLPCVLAFKSTIDLAMVLGLARMTICMCDISIVYVCGAHTLTSHHRGAQATAARCAHCPKWQSYGYAYSIEYSRRPRS